MYYKKIRGAIIAASVACASAVCVPAAQAQVPDLSGLAQGAGQATSLTAPLAGVLGDSANSDIYKTVNTLGTQAMNNANAANSTNPTNGNSASGNSTGTGNSTNGGNSTETNSTGGTGGFFGLGGSHSTNSTNGSSSTGGTGSTTGTNANATEGLATMFGGDSNSTSLGRNREADQEYKDAVSNALDGKLDTRSATKVASGLASFLPVAMGAVATDSAVPATLSSGVACGVGMTAAATTLMASGAAAAGGVGATAATGGAAAPLAALGSAGGAAGAAGAAAPAVAAAPKCIGAAGGAIKMAGILLKNYEDNPSLPQLVDVAAQLDPDNGGIGAAAWKNLPEDMQTESNAMVLKTTAKTFENLSRVKFGQVMAAYGDATVQLGNGNPAALAQVVPLTVNLGLNLLNAAAGGLSGLDISKLQIPGITDMKLPGMDSSLAGSSKETNASDELLTDDEIKTVSNFKSTSDDKHSTRSSSSRDSNEDERDSNSNSTSRTHSSKRNSDNEDTTSSSSRPSRSHNNEDEGTGDVHKVDESNYFSPDN